MITVLGDPHLGRRFNNGVPLERRGERETMVWDAFVASLLDVRPETTHHINLGDTFDSPIVPYDLILMTAQAYRDTARAHPHVDYVILQGNHDVFKDQEKASAFTILRELLDEVLNIIFVVDEAHKDGDMVFLPWHPTKTPEEMLTVKGKTLFCHCDTEWSETNMVPTTKAASLGFSKVVTGHVHKPTTFERDGIEVVVHGSLQPYAHGQEINEDLYVTRTVDQVRTDPTLYHDKCLRVIGTPDFDIDCLQLTIKKVAEEDEAVPEVSFGDFNFQEVFKQVFDEVGVPEDLRDTVLADYETRRLAE